jgi:hypothetical protein
MGIRSLVRVFWTTICIQIISMNALKSQTASIDSVNFTEKTAVIGAYISSLHDFNIAESTIGADIHLWCRYSNATFNFENELEFINCNNADLTGVSIDTLENNFWFYTKVKISSRQKYSTINYPFDKQNVRFSIESSEYTIEDLTFKNDIKGSKIDTSIYSSFDEWNISKTTFNIDTTVYNSSFGDPSSEKSSNSRFNIGIELQRKDTWLILFKLITGIIVSFLISVCVFWIKPINTDPRFGLCVGGLFAAIGNKYIVESIVPSSNELTLLDLIHNITFCAIFLIIILSIISLRIYEKGTVEGENTSKKIDTYSFYIIVPTFFILMAISIIAFIK